MSLELLQRIKKGLIERKERVERGGINCIPFPFVRFRRFFPGIQQGRYFVITGATKSSKTQITNYLFIYNTVLYCYHNPNVIRVKVFFFPLEETKEQISLRFAAFLINYVTQGRERVSPSDLESTDERKPVAQKYLDIMDSKEFTDIWSVYEEIVQFYEDRNPTGIYKTMMTYANEHGDFRKKKIIKVEEDGWGNKQEVEEEVFDRYIANDPDEYVIVVVDHVGLLKVEEKLGTLKATIEKLSEYFILLRNRFNYIPVVVQQQNTETTNLLAFKEGKIRPTKDGLKDSKRTGEDCNILIGLTNPDSFDLNDYKGYPIRNGLGAHFRVFEIVLNRNGEANTLCPLYFDGAINRYAELPTPDDTDSLDNYVQFVKNLEAREKAEAEELRRNTKRIAHKATPTLFIGTVNNSVKGLHKKSIFSTFASYFRNILINK